MEGPEFLKQKYDLHNSDEVKSAADRTETRTGESVPQKPADRIQNYLDRFNEIINRTDEDERERGVEALKQVLNDKFVIKPEEIPEGYFETQRRIAREQGHGEIEISKEIRTQLAEVVVADQESSLNKWIDYLASSDATYPDWLKYYAIRGVLGMGEFDKEKKQFTKRSEGTVKPFPDLNREALSYVLDAIEKKHGSVKSVVPPNIETEQEDVKKFEKLLQGENFSKLYAWAIEKVTPASEEQITITDGQWVKYDKNSDHMPLVESLQGHGTGWCTAGESTAEAQLKNGDFYVYYSVDQSGKPTVPRAAIRMQGNGIAEVRGIGVEQNLDPYIGGVVQEKLKEFPDGDEYSKKSENMKTLTLIENKVHKGEELSKEELIFLYEIETPIEGFGYQKDPRVEELLGTRSQETDLPIIFECAAEQIARSSAEIKDDTRVYVGKLEPGIFQKLPEDIEFIYQDNLRKRILKEDIEIGGKTSEELLDELKRSNIDVQPSARHMIQGLDLDSSQGAEKVTLVRLGLRDMGEVPSITGNLSDVHFNSIIRRVKELGLELCPPEVGLRYIIKHKNLPGGKDVCVGMEPMHTFDGQRDSVFRLYNLAAGEAGISGHLADETTNHYPHPFLFRLRHSKK